MFFLKKNFLVSSAILLASILIKGLNSLKIITISYYSDILMSLTILVSLTLLIRWTFDFVTSFIIKKYFSNWKRLGYFINLLSNLFIISFMLTGLFVSFYGFKFIINEVKIVISTVLIFSFIWNLFFIRTEIKDISNGYLKKIGVTEDNIKKHINTLFIDLKIISFIIILKFGIQVFQTLPFIINVKSLSVYFRYLFKAIDFFTLLYGIIIFRKLMLIFLERLRGQIKESENEVVKNYLFFIPLISNMGTILIFILFFLLVLNLFNYTAFTFVSSLPALIQSIGILGVGLSFIAKDTIANFMSGIFILTDTPFVIGDRIKINDVYGDVEEIGIRTTKIKTLENTIVTVPNSKFTENAVTSYRKYGSRIKIRYKIYLSYGTNLAKAKDIIFGEMSNNEDILKVPAPRIYFVKHDKNSLEMLLLFWIRDISRELHTLDGLNTSINEKFAEENIKFAHNTYDINIIK